MSTLKTSNIQDTSGNNNSTPEQINQGRAKAWVNFDAGTGVAIRDSFNVSSITDHTTGQQTVNFTNAMSNANYSVVATGNRVIADGGGTLFGLIMIDDNAAVPTTTAVRFSTIHTNGTAYDLDRVCVAVFGD